MPNYKKMYFTLFHTMTDVIKEMQIAQRKSEDIYVDEQPIKVKVRKVHKKKRCDRLDLSNGSW